MAFKFESEEELKEYIANLGTEYRFSCFKEKDAEACHLLGDYLEAVKKDFDASVKVFKANCDERKHPKSCYKFATYSYLGKGCDPDIKVSLDYYKKSCELGHLNACFNAGMMYVNPEKDPETKEPFMKADFVMGLKYIETACSPKVPLACYHASGFYIAGAEGVPQNKKKASQLSKIACEGGNIYACINLSMMYKRGDGVEKDEEKSLLYKERAKEIKDDMRKKRPLGLQQYT